MQVKSIAALTFIKFRIVILKEICFVFFEWLFYTGFTV